ncbi:hypothetical protein NDU88_005628 [Pleurodeles waltl]|uniref:Uncharacterized protein n=1 Tax=Pleurodeles waltl TaxID=8319 RepID=A0AAV7PJF7_PLEWA|nr:hypothetical protein NDU88_005628 [Pleurodeles waltl]
MHRSAGPSCQAPLRWALLSSTAPLGPPVKHRSAGPSSQAPLRWALLSSTAPLGPPVKHRWPIGMPGSVSGRASRGTLPTMPPP